MRIGVVTDQPDRRTPRPSIWPQICLIHADSRSVVGGSYVAILLSNRGIDIAGDVSDTLFFEGARWILLNVTICTRVHTLLQISLSGGCGLEQAHRVEIELREEDIWSIVVHELVRTRSRSSVALQESRAGNALRNSERYKGKNFEDLGPRDERRGRHDAVIDGHTVCCRRARCTVRWTR